MFFTYLKCFTYVNKTPKSIHYRCLMYKIRVKPDKLCHKIRVKPYENVKYYFW